MTTYVVWLVHNSIHWLPRSVDFADKALRDPANCMDDVEHVFIDGLVKTFTSRRSSDGTKGYCLDAGKFFYRPSDDTDKKNTALRYIDTRADKGDWVLFLSPGEELDEFFIPRARVGVVTFDRQGEMDNHARLVAWEKGLQFSTPTDCYDSNAKLVFTKATGEDDASCGVGRKAA